MTEVGFKNSKAKNEKPLPKGNGFDKLKTMKKNYLASRQFDQICFIGNNDSKVNCCSID